MEAEEPISQKPKTNNWQQKIKVIKINDIFITLVTKYTTCGENTCLIFKKAT